MLSPSTITWPSRDSEWMGKVYRFLGLTVGLVVHGVEANDRKAAYAADVTYGTNNEFGFDYLRDNMVVYKANMVQRGHAYAIVDEVDSILIDEARTPLIITGKGEDSSVMYKRADDFAKTLKTERYRGAGRQGSRLRSRSTAIMSWTKSARPLL